MKQENPSREPLFIKEVQIHQAWYEKIKHFTSSSTKAAAIMLVAAVLSLIVANTGLHDSFVGFWHTKAGFAFGDTEARMSLIHIVNDIFMAFFFLFIGLGIKYEMTVGELANIRQALLPILAACGGVLFPVIIYSIFNGANPETSHGWGIPAATDIAFALGIMMLLGKHIPNGIKVFLVTLAVADDIFAIGIIAVFYGQSPSVFWLTMVALVMFALIAMNRLRVFSIAPYLVGGVILWYCVYMSGIHATIAGVLLAFVIPTGTRVNLQHFLSWSGEKVKAAASGFQPDTHIMAQTDYLDAAKSLCNASRQVVPPAMRLEQALYPWISFVVLPLFAFANADVRFIGGELGNMWAEPAFLGVFFGLLVGKPIGITLFSFILVKLKIATLPKNVTWMHIFGAGILGGVGFTMAIFVANLSFAVPATIATAKLAILAASAIAGVVGFVFLFVHAKIEEKRNIAHASDTGMYE